MTTRPPVNWNVPMYPAVQGMLTVGMIVTAMALVLVVFRFYVRRTTRAGMGLDDWLILAALPWGLGTGAIQAMLSALGTAHSLVEIKANALTMSKLILALEYTYSTGMCLVKLSILSFYLRAFVTPKMKLASKISMVIVFLWTCGNWLQPLLLCKPISKIIDRRLPGTCGDRIGSFIAIGTFSLVTDILILSLPLHTVWHLQMDFKTKVGLTGILLLGPLVTIAAACRIYYLSILDSEGDFPVPMTPSVFLTTVELNLAIATASLPMLGPLIFRRRHQRESERVAEAISADTKQSSNSTPHKRRDLYSTTATFEGSDVALTDVHPDLPPSDLAPERKAHAHV